MAFSQLNGWRRLWVVIAAITFVWALLHAMSKASTTSAADYRVVAAFENSECEHIRILPKGFELEIEPEYGSPCYGLYFENKHSDTPLRTVEAYLAQVSKHYRQSLLSWLTASLVIWAVGLALLYGAGTTAAWVRQGFRGPPSGAP